MNGKSVGLLAAWLALAPLGQAASPAPDPRDQVASQSKSQLYNGFLDFSGTASYEISNASQTLFLSFGRLDNQSSTHFSGTIMIALFVTTAPLVPGQGFTYWIVGRDYLDPLLPNYFYSNVSGTVPLESVPDGVYYVYLGAFEYENNCGSLSGYCLDDYYTFTNQIQVIDGSYYAYTPTAATTTAVEYFHAGFGHYFVTAQSDEIAGLDGGAFGGAWQRTGQTFKVWTGGSGLVDVCRFFTVYFAPKSSHFYTANASECAGLMGSPVWQFEKLAFKVKLPSGGACPAGSVPLYRLYNDGMTGAPNHAYATTLSRRSQLIAQGFVPEDANTFCVPN